PDDAKHRARRAVARITRDAARARPAARVDLADHALAVRDADELVPDRAAKPGVAALELEIGVADARQRDSHEHLTVRARLANVDERAPAIGDAQRSHPDKRSAIRCARWRGRRARSASATWRARAWSTKARSSGCGTSTTTARSTI